MRLWRGKRLAQPARFDELTWREQQEYRRLMCGSRGAKLLRANRNRGLGRNAKFQRR